MMDVVYNQNKNQMALSTQKRQMNIMVFILSILVFIYAFLSTHTNVYTFKLTGVIFEILWLPACILIFACPIIAILNWYKEKFSPQSINLFSLILSLATILTILFAAKGYKS